MFVTAKLRHLRIAPRKVRLVANLIRGKSVEEAQNILSFTIKKAAAPTLKLLNSAVANAKNNFQLDASNLFISKIMVDEGPKYKRWMPRARGQASEIQKKVSHITVVLDQITKKPRKPKRAKKAKAVEEVKKTAVAGEEKDKQPKIKIPKPEIAKEAFRPEVKRGIKRIFRRKV